MTMDFITLDINSVPLIEDLRSANSCEFEFSGLHSHLLLSFFAGNMLKKKIFSPKSHPTFLHIFSNVYLVHMYEYKYAEIWSIWILRALQVSCPDPWTHIQVPPAQCVCIYIDMHPHTNVHTYTQIHIHPHTLRSMLSRHSFYPCPLYASQYVHISI